MNLSGMRVALINSVLHHFRPGRKFAMKIFFLTICCVLLAACGPSAEERYDDGYADGYAEGYNTHCEIRATLVEGA